MHEKRMCEKCLREKALKAFSGDDSKYCRLCQSGKSSSAARAEGIEKRYPDVVCPNCGGLVQNLVRHFRQEHPDSIGVVSDLCMAIADPGTLELNQRLLSDQQVADRDRIWDTNTSVVYFLQAGDLGRPVKIGYTTDLCARLVCIQSGCPEPMNILLTMLGGRELEREMHTKFADLRVHQEWFRVSRGMMEFLLEARAETDPVPVRKRGSLHVVRRRKPEKFTYDECRAIAQQNGVSDSNEWYTKHKAGLLPKGTPFSPRHAYQQEWKTWGEFLEAPELDWFDPDTKPEVAIPDPDSLKENARELRARVKYKAVYEAISNRGGESFATIAGRFGLSGSTLKEIYAGRHWTCELLGYPQGRVVPRGEERIKKPPRKKLTVAELGVIHRKFSPEQEAEIVADYKTKSVAMLVREYKSCWQTIRGILARNKVEVRSAGVGPRKLKGKGSWKRSPEELQKFKGLHEALSTRQSETQQEIADRFGVSLATIDNINAGKHWSCQFFGQPEPRTQSKNAKGRFSVGKRSRKVAGVRHWSNENRGESVMGSDEGTTSAEELTSAFDEMLGLESE